MHVYLLHAVLPTYGVDRDDVDTCANDVQLDRQHSSSTMVSFVHSYTCGVLILSYVYLVLLLCGFEHVSCFVFETVFHQY